MVVAFILHFTCQPISIPMRQFPLITFLERVSEGRTKNLHFFNSFFAFFTCQGKQSLCCSNGDHNHDAYSGRCFILLFSLPLSDLSLKQNNNSNVCIWQHTIIMSNACQFYCSTSKSKANGANFCASCSWFLSLTFATFHTSSVLLCCSGAELNRRKIFVFHICSRKKYFI